MRRATITRFWGAAASSDGSPISANRPPGGDFTSARGTMGKGPTPYANVHRASYRGVYGFAGQKLGLHHRYRTIRPPALRHYDDLAELWRRSEYIPMSLDPALARGAGGEIHG